MDPLAAALLENSLLGVLITVGDKVEMANDRALRLLGYSGDEITKIKLSDLIRAKEKTEADLIEVASNDVVRAIAKAKSGNDISVELSTNSFTVDDVKKTLVILLDARDVESIESLKKEFMRKVSFDLRSPLTAISGSLAILRSERLAKLSDSVRNVVTIAERNCKRLTLMINDILELERLEAGKIKLQPRTLNLGSVIKGSLDMVRAVCDEASVSVEPNTTDTIIFADEERITQLFANLLRNAIRSSDKGGVVLIENSGNDEWAEVKVVYSERDKAAIDATPQIDWGIEDDLASLTLDLCKDVVSLHDGYFGFEDKDKSKMTYWVRIPITQAEKSSR